jgi:hypothetical protein
VDSPWIEGFERKNNMNLEDFKHFILKFTNYTIEFISKQLVFENFQEKPLLKENSK